MAIQRYLSTRDERSARRSFAIHLATEVLMSLLLGVVGLAVLAYFVANPGLSATSGDAMRYADELLPRFVMVGMPAGMSGLVIAAILSAAMSSLSSGMNSSSAVISTDWIGRFWKTPRSEADQVRQARIICIIVGGVAIALSTVVGQLAENLLELCIKVVNLLTAPIFVLFFLALFIPWATPLGAVAATLASVSVAAGIAFFHMFGLEFLWSSPCSLAAGITVGILVSLGIPRAKGQSPKSKVQSPKSKVLRPKS
jgi:SSS family solute:Na+ symporter